MLLLPCPQGLSVSWGACNGPPETAAVNRLHELHDLLFHKAQKPGCCNLTATTGLLCHHQKPTTSPLAQVPPTDVLASLLLNLT